jgi:subtilase family protein
MSWTINKTEENADAMEKLKGAVNEAIKEKILLFCSVSDQGAKDEEIYPANCNRQDSFLIGSATITGKSWKWNGANEVDYILPGTDLEVKIGDELFDRHLKRLCESGSSLATALASGLAALILDCVALRTPKDIHYLREPKGMKRAFGAINTNQYANADDNKYLRVWDTFGRALRDEKMDERESLGLVVTKLLLHAKELTLARSQIAAQQQTQVT